MRLAGLWILLVAVYAATLGIPAQTGLDYAGAEPHHLLAAESIVSDRDVDLTDEYADRAYASWYPRDLETDGQVVGGRLVEPHGVGFALLIAPAYAIGGARAVQGEMLVAAGLRVRARRRARAAAGPRALRDPRRRPRRPLPSRARGQHRDHPGRPRRGPAGRRGAVRPRRARAAAPARRLRRRAPARRAALAGLDLRGARRGHRLGARRLDAARAAPPGGARRRRGALGLAGLLRHDQRPLLRRADTALGGAHRAAGVPHRLRRAHAPHRRPVAGPRGRPACAGRRCSRSSSSPAGCCTARAATNSPASPRPAARPRPAPVCCSASSARPGRRGRAADDRRPARRRRSRACRSSPRCPRSPR